jgi:hypothetical protein
MHRSFFYFVLFLSLSLHSLSQVPDVKNFSGTDSDDLLKLALEADDPKMTQEILSSPSFDLFFANPAEIYLMALRQKKNKVLFTLVKDKKFVSAVEKEVGSKLPPNEQEENLMYSTIGEAADYANHDVFTHFLKDYKKKIKNISDATKFDLTQFTVRSGSVKNFSLLKSLGLFKINPKEPSTYYTHVATKFGTGDFYDLLRKEKLFDPGFSPKGIAWIHQIAMYARQDLLDYFVKNKIGNPAELTKDGLSAVHYAVMGNKRPNSTTDPRFETYHKLIALGLPAFPEIMKEDGTKQNFNQFIEEIDDTVFNEVIKINALKGIYQAPDKITSYLFVVFDSEKNPSYKTIKSENDIEKMTTQIEVKKSPGAQTTQTIKVPLDFPSGLLELSSNGKPVAKKYFLKQTALNYQGLGPFSFPEIDRLPPSKTLSLSVNYSPETSWGLAVPKKLSLLLLKKISFRAKGWPVEAYETISVSDLTPKDQEFQGSVTINNEGSLFSREKLSSFTELSDDEKKSIYNAFMDHLHGKPASPVPWMKNSTATLDVVIKNAGLPESTRLFLPRPLEELQFTVFDSYGEVTRKLPNASDKIEIAAKFDRIEKENPELLKKSTSPQGDYFTLDEKKVLQGSSLTKLKSQSGASLVPILKIDSSVSKKIMAFMKSEQEKAKKAKPQKEENSLDSGMNNFMYLMLEKILTDETLYNKFRFFRTSEGKWIFEMDPL